MAGPGTDAAEGDRGRSAAPAARATGWRVPSVTTTRSGLPETFLDVSSPEEGRVDDGSAPRTAVLAGSPGSVVDTPADTAAPAGELVAFGRAEAMIRRWRGWSFSFRRRKQDPAIDEAPDGPDLDLVALAAEDDLAAGDTSEQAWTDLALAGLDDPDPTDAWAPGLWPTRLGVLGIEVNGRSSDAADGPWAMLAAELQEHDSASAEPVEPSSQQELEEEFWARGTR